MSSTNQEKLFYKPKELKRELRPYYISANNQEIENMLKDLNFKNLDELFSHIPADLKFTNDKTKTESIPYNDLIVHLEDISKKNKRVSSFIGDGLKNYRVPELVSKISRVRGLATAYTPYQPERGQGTLQSLWIYSSLMSMLTGFEAVNASLYERSTAIFEAIHCALRQKRGTTKALVLSSIYPGDKEVLKTQIKHTQTEIEFISVNTETGVTDISKVESSIQKYGKELGVLVFPQINSLGNLEDIDALTDLCKKYKILSVAIIDPILLATGGLKPPIHFGSDKNGVDMIVGEGQHLGSGPGFGGPGLGIFGIRYSNKHRAGIRSTPGRFVSKSYDITGKECKTLVLSTREQHIRRDKATSNICSNQSFMASIIGAAILARGEEGMTKAIQTSRNNALEMACKLTSYSGVSLAFPQTPFYNEFVLKLPYSSKMAIKKASEKNIHIGVDVSERTGNEAHLLVSFFDTQTKEDLDNLCHFFTEEFGPLLSSGEKPATIDPIFLRNTTQEDSVKIPNFSEEEIVKYYEKLGRLNVSPDENIYALGSCTMKYNPYINEYTASLPGFTDIHPQAPLEDTQGCLEILYQIQEIFKDITGLNAVTTQPVAGAQGELLGIKLFQAYHHDRSESERNIMLIPHSAHGTNPASATVAGCKIIEVEAGSDGTIDIYHLKEILRQYGPQICGIMVTNPNTSGIFEKDFKEMSNLVHESGGLVYMDGANMNAIAGRLDLSKLGVDAIHNNLHKTWSIPHGGGGPGDAIVAVSEKLEPYLPGIQVYRENGIFKTQKPPKSIGSFHRHYGNFLHKVRCYTYLKALGSDGVKTMSGMAVLCSRYLHHHISKIYPILPEKTDASPRMHEFIITLPNITFEKVEHSGIQKNEIIAKIGKLFLDFGIHAPTVAFPEIFGLMIEPTESFTKEELDRFIDTVKAIHLLVSETPEILKTTPHFTPINKIDEVQANKTPEFSEVLKELPKIFTDNISPEKLAKLSIGEICKEILTAHKNAIYNS